MDVKSHHWKAEPLNSGYQHEMKRHTFDLSLKHSELSPAKILRKQIPSNLDYLSTTSFKA